MQFLNTFLYVIVGVTLTIVGDVFLKKSHLENYWFVALGIFFYVCGVIPVAIIFKKMDFGSVFLVWEALTVILALLIANFYFKEPFTVYKSLALALAIGALYFSYK